jgi:hypothetical protein
MEVRTMNTVRRNPGDDSRALLESVAANMASTHGALMLEHDDRDFPIDRAVVREACQDIVTAMTAVLAARDEVDRLGAELVATRTMLDAALATNNGGG